MLYQLCVLQSLLEYCGVLLISLGGGDSTFLQSGFILGTRPNVQYYVVNLEQLMDIYVITIHVHDLFFVLTVLVFFFRYKCRAAFSTP